MEPRTTNVRSPLSLGLSHHQQQQQQSLMGGQNSGGGGTANNLDYLGGNNPGRNSLDIPRSNDLRLSSPTPTVNNDILSNNNNNGGSDHIMGAPNGGAQHHQGLVGTEESGQLTSPAQNNAVRTSQSLDANAANNAAFMALRANPETTIRPLSSGLGSPEMPTNDLQGGVGGAPGGHDPQFSAASELINRYRLEQTINQLRGHHGFSADPRGPSGLTGLPFNQHNQV